MRVILLGIRWMEGWAYLAKKCYLGVKKGEKMKDQVSTFHEMSLTGMKLKVILFECIVRLWFKVTHHYNTQSALTNSSFALCKHTSWQKWLLIKISFKIFQWHLPQKYFQNMRLRILNLNNVVKGFFHVMRKHGRKYIWSERVIYYFVIV